MKRVSSLTLLVALALLISACNFPFVNTEDAMATSVAETVEAMESHIVKPTLVPLPTQAPPVPTAGPQPAPQDQPKPTLPVEPTKNPCLFATFVKETIPDNTVFSPGETFTKSWTLKNTGYCDWNVDYRLDFKSGDHMNGPDYVKISAETDPGETIKISVDLKAPSDEGTHIGYWQMQTDDGVNFGEIWVKIKVE
jgi:hypothetical protein